jgi:hypothetical protein
MFEPNEESIVLEIVRGFFDIPSEDMIAIGDKMKTALFESPTASEEQALSSLKAALQDLSKEQVLIAGMFVSGLLRCNLSEQIEQQYLQAQAEGRVETD